MVAISTSKGYWVLTMITWGSQILRGRSKSTLIFIPNVVDMLNYVLWNTTAYDTVVWSRQQQNSCAAFSKASARERSPTKQYLWRSFLLFSRQTFAGARFAESSTGFRLHNGGQGQTVSLKINNWLFYLIETFCLPNLFQWLLVEYLYISPIAFQVTRWRFKVKQLVLIQSFVCWLLNTEKCLLLFYLQLSPKELITCMLRIIQT